MLLVVDIGNSSVTTALVRGESGSRAAGSAAGGSAAAGSADLGPIRRAATERGASAERFGAVLGGLLALDGVAGDDLDAVVLSSVVPELTDAAREIATRMGLRLLVASAGTVPIPVRVPAPEAVGADRIVNAYAAARLHRTPAVVLDFGTATTVDAVDRDGGYLGGAIAPGLELGLEALATRTALLPRVELRRPERAIGRDTVSAIQAGTVLGYRALAAGLLAQVREELAEISGVPEAEIVGIATGGLSAADWIAGIDGIDVVDPALTLRGLAALWAEVGAGVGAMGAAR